MRAGLVAVGNAVAEGAPERFAQVNDRPAVMQLGTKALAALFPPPTFFVDPRGSDVVPADVRRIQFVPYSPVAPASAPAFTLERQLDGWTLSAGAMPTAPASAEAVRRLLAQLCEARAPAVAFQALPEQLRIGEFRLVGAGDAPLATIRLAHEPEGQWALDSADGVLRVFPPNFGILTDAAGYAGTR